MQGAGARGLDASVYRQVFEDLPSATLVLDSSGAVLGHNAAARELFGAALEREGLRCCDLVGCNAGSFERPLAHHCLTAAVLEHGSPLRELDFTFAGRRMEIAAAPLAGGIGAVVEVWRAQAPAAAKPAPAPLRITTLGGLRARARGPRPRRRLAAPPARPAAALPDLRARAPRARSTSWSRRCGRTARARASRACARPCTSCASASSRAASGTRTPRSCRRAPARTRWTCRR